jgi:putative ABC transport system ATP-binding protein
MEPFIKIRNLKKIYKMGEERVKALDGIDLDIYKNEILCLLGTSGSGKSTLLNMLAGLEKPTAGEIIVDGRIHIEKLNEIEVTKFRQKNIGFVFQAYNLIANLDAVGNVELGLIFKGIDEKKRRKMSEEILKNVGLENRMHHKPSEMSGGQQQRVSIARAFVDNPKIIFADEPTGNLDSRTSIEIMNMMTEMVRKYNQTLILVTHDITTSTYADRIVEIRDGKIIDIRENVQEEKISNE